MFFLVQQQAEEVYLFSHVLLNFVGDRGIRHVALGRQQPRLALFVLYFVFTFPPGDLALKITATIIDMEVI